MYRLYKHIILLLHCVISLLTSSAAYHTILCSVDLTSHDEIPLMGAPIKMTYPVHIKGGYDITSTVGILQPVKIDGKYTLSLGGQCLDCSDSKN